jgi:hypothetical protein
MQNHIILPVVRSAAAASIAAAAATTRVVVVAVAAATASVAVVPVVVASTAATVASTLVVRVVVVAGVLEIVVVARGSVVISGKEGLAGGFGAVRVGLGCVGRFCGGRLLLGPQSDQNIEEHAQSHLRMGNILELCNI